MAKVHPAKKQIQRAQAIINQQHARPREATAAMARKTKKSKELND